MMKMNEMRGYIILATLFVLTIYYSFTVNYSTNARSKIQQIGDINCSLYPDKSIDFCWYRYADDAENNSEKIKYCKKIQNDVARFHCLIDAVIYETNISVVESTCNIIGDSIFNSECFFRAAEEMARVQEEYGLAYDLCKLSREFEFDCIGHLEDIIHQKSETDAMQFCKTVRIDYQNISKIPINYCFNHFGLRLGRETNEEPCVLVEKCNECGDYAQLCISGLINIDQRKEEICSCIPDMSIKQNVCR